METDMKNLPQDPGTLQKLVQELLEALKNKDLRIQQLTHQLARLQRSQFGRKSEKIDTAQLLLAFEELKALQKEAVETAEEAEENAAPSRKRRGHGRKKLPETLRRERIVIPVSPEERTCPCCKLEKDKIGEEVTEVLEYVPASFFVVEYVRPKFACRKCEGEVSIGELPARPVDKGKFGPGFMGFVLTSKYADHIPLHRMVGMFAREGVRLSPSTLCDTVGRCADLLDPIVKAMARDLLLSKVINTDDTPVPVLDRDRDRTRKGRLWVYIGDERHPYALFDYTPGREASGPRAFLEGFRAYLQADAYGGYDGLFTKTGPTEVGCWAHARRYFYDAKSTEPLPAHTALAFIRRLYDVEKEGKLLNPEARKSLRKEKAQPVLDEFRIWLSSQSRLVLPKSPMGDAIRYTLAQWEALVRYLEDGDLPIDNNVSERALRSVVIGRKNWMFAGSDEGGRRAAVIYSLVATCKRHGIDPFEYFRDVLDRISTHPASAIEALFPHNWKAARKKILNDSKA
jgi:transposase